VAGRQVEEVEVNGQKIWDLGLPMAYLQVCPLLP